MDIIKAYFDGSCISNPGGAIGYGCTIGHDQIWKGESASPINTNNVAEYRGLLLILKHLQESKITDKEIHIYGDSNMVINQMNRVWKVKRKGNYYQDAVKAIRIIDALKLYQNLSFVFKWIPREENTVADELSNQFYIANNLAT